MWNRSAYPCLVGKDSSFKSSHFAAGVTKAYKPPTRMGEQGIWNYNLMAEFCDLNVTVITESWLQVLADVDSTTHVMSCHRGMVIVS